MHTLTSPRHAPEALECLQTDYESRHNLLFFIRNGVRAQDGAHYVIITQADDTSQVCILPCSARCGAHRELHKKHTHASTSVVLATGQRHRGPGGAFERALFAAPERVL